MGIELELLKSVYLKGIDYFQFIGGIYSQYANKCCEFFLPKASSYAIIFKPCKR